MVFSSKTEYGLVALLELAGHYGSGGVMQAGEIATRQRIPDRYLEQMLTSLRRGGILRSVRGPRGGYQLTRPPAEILVSDVVRCLEGDSGGGEDHRRHTPEFEAMYGLAGDLDRARLQTLQTTSLQVLMEQRDALLQAQAMYFI